MAGAVRLGVPFQGKNGDWFVVAKSHAALVAGTPYLITFTYDSYVKDGTTYYQQDAITAAVDAVASIPRLIAWAQADEANTDVEVVLKCGGEMDVLCDGGTNDIAVGNFLKIIPGTSTDVLVYEGTTITASSMAIALEAYADATAALKKVFIIPFCATAGRVVNT